MKNISELKKRDRGRLKGEGKKLTVIDERIIIETMICVSPNEYGEKPFWTKESVKTLMEEKLNIHISQTTASDYLKRWNLLNNKTFTIKKYFQRSQSLRKWLWEIYTPIVKNASKNNADVLFVESYSAVRFPEDLTKKSVHYQQWNKKCYRMNIVAAYGKKAFILSSVRYDGYEVINFFKNLIRDSDRKIYLILKLKKIYPAKPIKEWLDKNSDKIEVHYAPFR